MKKRRKKKKGGYPLLPADVATDRGAVKGGGPQLRSNQPTKFYRVRERMGVEARGEKEEKKKISISSNKGQTRIYTGVERGEKREKDRIRLTNSMFP